MRLQPVKKNDDSQIPVNLFVNYEWKTQSVLPLFINYSSSVDSIIRFIVSVQSSLMEKPISPTESIQTNSTAVPKVWGLIYKVE